MRRAPVRAPCLSLLIITPPNPHDAYRIWPVYGVLYAGCMLTHGDWDEFRQVRGMADKVGLWARFTAYDLVERGKSAINSGKYQRALELCEQAIATNPQSADAWFTLGWALLKLETRNEDAAAAFERAIALKPHNPWAWNNIGVLRHRAKQLDAALALDPELVPAWQTKADVLRTLGREAEAVEAERRAGELDAIQQA